MSDLLQLWGEYVGVALMPLQPLVPPSHHVLAQLHRPDLAPLQCICAHITNLLLFSWKRHLKGLQED